MLGLNTLSAEASNTIYKVKEGDSLWKISLTSSTTVANLKKLNNLKGNEIYIGQSLNTETLIDKVERSNSHIVKSGETLYLISQKYNLTIESLKEMNHLNSDNIYVGQVLNLDKIKTTQATDSSDLIYVVKSGDTLYKIAQRYNITINVLKTNNKLSSENLIVGQKLIINQTNITDSSSLIENIINEGYKYIGIPYAWGGTSPSGFDCSGFVYFLYENQGIGIPRTVETLWDWNNSISVDEPKRGDIVYFETYKAGPSHMGIYLGNGEFIHASSSVGVTVSKMDNPYYKQRYLGVKHIVLN